MGYCCSLRVASVRILPLNWSVIELASLNDKSIVIVRFLGRLSVSDLTVFETALLDRHAGHEHIRVLFDWTGIEGWEPGAGALAKLARYGSSH